jgi:ABC-2 type transport system ATP-binding protein
VAGYDLEQSGQIRQAVGLVVSDERSFHWRLSGRQNLQFFAALYGLQGAQAGGRLERLLAEFDLLSVADRRFSSYSTGMRQRLAIARSLLHEPRILFLDEPSRSLDPGATARLHQVIERLVEGRQVTVFLITHDLAEAEKLCRRVAVMHQGRLGVIGRPQELRRQLGRQVHYSLRVSPLSDENTRALQEQFAGLECRRVAGHSQVNFRAGESDGRLTAVLDALRGRDIAIHTIEGRPPSLEEVFAHYTGQPPVGGAP